MRGPLRGRETLIAASISSATKGPLPVGGRRDAAFPATSTAAYNHSRRCYRARARRAPFTQLHYII